LFATWWRTNQNIFAGLETRANESVIILVEYLPCYGNTVQNLKNMHLQAVQNF